MTKNRIDRLEDIAKSLDREHIWSDNLQAISEDNFISDYLILMKKITELGAIIHKGVN